jgi:hypothetical protein
MDVKETDKEIIIEAELPGLEEKDISLTLQNGILTVQGEKKSSYDEEKENEEPRPDYRRSRRARSESAADGVGTLGRLQHTPRRERLARKRRQRRAAARHRCWAE